MRPTAVPAFELRVALRDPDGQVCARTRLCWADSPSSASVLTVLLGQIVEARERSLTLVVEQAPAGLGALLAAAGLDDLLVDQLGG